MVDKQKIITLINRGAGRAGYSIPEMGGLHRTFAPNEKKEVTFEEIEKLSWVDGGRAILKDYLIIADEEAAQEILGVVEPEYFYTIREVKKLLEKGSLSQLQDALEFAPEGVIDVIKKEAVESNLNDVAKRQEIQKATHFSVDKAIEINNEANNVEDNNQKSEEVISKRRAQPIAVDKK